MTFVGNFSDLMFLNVGTLAYLLKLIFVSDNLKLQKLQKLLSVQKYKEQSRKMQNSLT